MSSLDPKDEQILQLQGENETLLLQVTQLNERIATLEAEVKAPPKNPNLYEIWDCFNQIAFRHPPENYIWYQEKAKEGLAYSEKLGGGPTTT
jgi:hypothetical protein